MKKIFIYILLITLLLSQRVSADVGPKPSVNISFDNVGNKTYYVTLLSETDVYGPYHDVGNNLINDVQNDEDKAFNVIAEYALNDDYYFYGDLSKIDKDNNLYRWSYYPPKKFKLAIYCVEDGTLRVSDTYERVAFDSYFNVDMNDTNIILDEKVELGNRFKGFALRVIVTILVEVLLGLLFTFRSKKEIKTIVIVNLITQLLLNLIMLFFDYYLGAMVWMIIFPILEIVILVIEIIVYMISFKDKKKWKIALYAIIANAITFYIGLMTGMMFSV